jgi:hypothetical protein
VDRSAFPLKIFVEKAVRAKADFLNAFNVIWPVQSSLRKYSASPPPQIKSISVAIPPHSEGRFANVTDAGRDAVDAAARLTGDANADGEDVWS